MTNKVKKGLILIVFLILIASCSSPFLSVSKLGECELGQDYRYFNGENSDFDVNVKSLHNLENLSSNENRYKVLLYETLLYSSNFGFYSSKDYTFTALAFENNKLIFFGYPEDYLKNDSELINDIGIELVSIIEKEIE